jgi:plastocyanin
MHVELKNITGARPGLGYVIVEVPYLVKDEKEDSLHLVATETIGDYTVRSGVVVSYSEETEVPGMNMMFDAPVEVSVGDKVWWIANASQHIASSGDNWHKVIRSEGRTFLLIPHKRLVMKLEAGEFVGLNDHVITEPVELTHEFLDMGEVENKGQTHRIIATPRPGVVYHPTAYSVEYPIAVSKGMNVILRVPRTGYIEHEFDQTLPGRWCAFQSKYILGGEHAQIPAHTKQAV